MTRPVVTDYIARDRSTATVNKIAASNSRLAKDINNANASIKRSARSVSDETSRMATVSGRAYATASGHIKTFATISGGAVVAAGALAAGMVTAGLKTAASMEQAQIAFSTLLGSTTKATAFIGDLKKFAAQTPFEIPGLIDASRQLIGAGLAAKDVIPTLTAYGDAAGALGLSQDNFNHIMLATTQAMSAGTLHAGDLLQMTEAGLPVWKLMSEALHKPVSELRKMSEQGQLMTKDVLPKLQHQMELDYGGAMAKQSQTLAGLWSTLMDTFHQGLADALIPLEPMLRKAIPRAAEIMSGALRTLGTSTASFFKGLSDNVEQSKSVQLPAFERLGLGVHALADAFRGGGVTSGGFIGTMQRIGGTVRQVADFVRREAPRIFAGIGPAISNFASVAVPVMAQAWAAFKEPLANIVQFVVNEVLPGLSKLFDWMSRHTGLVTDAAVAIGSFMAAFKTYKLIKDTTEALRGLTAAMAANPILAAAAAILAIGLALYTAYKNSRTFRDNVHDAFDDIKIWALEVAQWVLRYVVIPVTDVFSTIVHGAAAAFGWVPGIGDKLRGARDQFDTFRKGVDSSLSGIQANIDTAQAAMKARDLARQIDDIKQNKVPGLTANNEPGKKKIAELQAQIDALTQKPPPPPVTVLTAEGRGKIAVFQRQIDEIKQGLVPGINANTVEGQRRIKFLQDSINAIKQGLPPPVDTNPSGGMAKIAALQRQINEIKQGLVPGINTDTSAGRIRLQQLQDQIDNLRDGSVTVNVLTSWGSIGAGGLANPANRRTGGPIQGPGGPRADRVPILASAGEFMMNADAVSKYGLGFMANLNAQKFAGGGAIINLTVPSAAGILSGVNNAENQAAQNLIRNTPREQLLSRIFGSGTPGNFSGSVLDWVFAAETITGTPASWTAAILRRINYESGGNPNAINLWDSNAAAGDPSRGLMQTIGSTFAAYHVPGTSSNIFDPVANIAAALQYIKSRYGSIFAIDPPVQGYRDGAWRIASDRLAWLHLGEMVLPEKIADSVRRGGGDGGGIVISPGAIAVYAAPSQSAHEVARIAVVQIRRLLDDERRLAAKGQRA